MHPNDLQCIMHFLLNVFPGILPGLAPGVALRTPRFPHRLRVRPRSQAAFYDLCGDRLPTFFSTSYRLSTS
jgi:hypothetical protein